MDSDRLDDRSGRVTAGTPPPRRPDGEASTPKAAQTSMAPTEWFNIADKLEAVAAVVRQYVIADPAPWPAAAAREKAQERDFSVLPFKHPVTEAHLAPLQLMGVAQDHLVAMAAVIRAPFTVMALLTLLRTQIVATAWAWYLTDPHIDIRERVRRANNLQLQSVTEQMRLLGLDRPETAAEYERLDQHRREIAAGAKRLKWKVAMQESKKNWPQDWWIGDKPPTEMTLVGQALRDDQLGELSGKTLYRYLSATTHAQPHALLSFVDPDQLVRRTDGSAVTALRMRGDTLLTLAMTAVAFVNAAAARCIAFYGWPPEQWLQEVVPIFNAFRINLETSIM
jgi:hypothetical protein